jgi:chromosome partitioning protein
MELQEEFLKAYPARSLQRVDAAAVPIRASIGLEEVVSLAVINQKGGCGKTTTAINLSACLAEMGYSVLLIDLDPQAHATLGLGVRGDELEWTVYHLLLRTDLALTRILQPTYHRNLKLLPANGLLSSAQMELLSVPQRDQILKSRLQELMGLFHLILIDCPPSLNILTINALTAATRLIVPIQTQYYSLDGMRELFKTIELVKENSNPQLEILGILPTLFDGRTKMNRAMLKALQEYFRGQIFETVVHLSASLAECPMMGQPVTRYAPGGRGAADYWRLAEEVVHRAAGIHRSPESVKTAV